MYVILINNDRWTTLCVEPIPGKYVSKDLWATNTGPQLFETVEEATQFIEKHWSHPILNQATVREYDEAN